jgi:hypothetical protein
MLDNNQALAAFIHAFTLADSLGLSCDGCLSVDSPYKLECLCMTHLKVARVILSSKTPYA